MLRSSRVIPLLGALAALAFVTGNARAADKAPLDTGGQAIIQIAPPASKPFGKTYGEWGAEWWKWALAVPLPVNPVIDATSGACDAGQRGPVWFLAGASCPAHAGCAVPTTRSCQVPAGKAVLIPIVNAQCSTFQSAVATESELRACAEASLGAPRGLFCEIDSFAVPTVARYGASSGVFTWGPLPGDNLLQASGVNAPAGTSSVAVESGTYVMVMPLALGAHTLRFGDASTTVTYQLTVVDQGPDSSTPTRDATWGRLKVLYR